MKQDIILIGGGGHCKSVIDVIESGGNFNIIGIIDQKDKVNNNVLGYKIIGTDDDLDDLIINCNNFHITIGQIKNNESRVRLYNSVLSKGGNFPVIISSKAYVSKYAMVNHGSIIMHNAFVNVNAKVGNNCIINSGAVIEHDVVIENHCHIATGSYVNGESYIRQNSFIGSNSTIIQCITIAENSIIAAGAVVTKNTEANSIYTGNPALKIKTIV